MESLPAEDFLKRFVSAYGESWNEVFGELTNERPCAQHMAEFIDDLEEYGQQTPVYIDETGCVNEGNKLVLAQYILGNDIVFKFGSPPPIDVSSLFIIEFDIESGDGGYLYRHSPDFLSFRVGADWVLPIDANADDDEFIAAMYVPSGQYVADRLEPIVVHRVSALAGIEPIGFRCSQADPAEVDEDAGEW